MKLLAIFLLSCIIAISGIPTVTLATGTASSRSCFFLNKLVRSVDIRLQNTVRIPKAQINKTQAKYRAVLKGIQRDRRKIGCIGDKHYDRKTTRACLRLNARTGEIKRNLKLLGQKESRLFSLGYKIKSELEVAQTQIRLKQCGCWKHGLAHTFMPGRNIAGFVTKNVYTCKAACDRSYNCKSLEFNVKNRGCYLNDLDTRGAIQRSARLIRDPKSPFRYFERCEARW